MKIYKKEIYTTSSLADYVQFLTNHQVPLTSTSYKQ